MIRADNGNDGPYDYSPLKELMKIRQIDDEMNYQESFNVTKMRAEENPDLITALNNVLTLASERAEQFKSPHLRHINSIKTIKKFMAEYQAKDDC